MPPDRGLMTKQMSGVKGVKKRITYALTTNADGSEQLPPFIIGKAARPRAFKRKTGAQLGFLYRNNAKAWMTTKLYREWLTNVDAQMRLQKRHILLLQDNFSGHNPPKHLTNVRVENFVPNLTAHVQPMDAGVIRCFKAHYRRYCMQRALDRYDEGITPSDIYDIDQLQAMRLADLAWKQVTPKTIANCWRKSGILPDRSHPSESAPAIDDESDDANDAEKGLLDSLEQLQEVGVLQKSNTVDLEDLVHNPAEQIIEDATDEEIADAVRKLHQAEEDREKNGGDDDEEIDPKPSRQEALQAVSTLSRYLADLDDPFARSLEAALSSFGRETRREATEHMITTKITDYFRSA
jgi:hypothetical protein